MNMYNCRDSSSIQKYALIRSHDLRISSDCNKVKNPVPHAALQGIEKIYKSVQRIR